MEFKTLNTGINKLDICFQYFEDLTTQKFQPIFPLTPLQINISFTDFLFLFLNSLTQHSAFVLYFHLKVISAPPPPPKNQQTIVLFFYKIPFNNTDSLCQNKAVKSTKITVLGLSP